MDLRADFLHIGGFINTHMSTFITVATIIGIISIICAIACAVISVMRKDLIEDVVFAAIFGFVFNVMGLLFVIFRKPVWNNLGWIPVVAAWFFFDGNLLMAIFLITYAVIWAFSQHELLDRIKVVEE